MSLTKRFGLIVGAAASLSSAMAQSTMDQSRALNNELFSDSARQVSQKAAGAFTVNLHGYEQVRFSINSRDDATLDNDMAWGFSNARTRVNLSGNVFSEDWSYFIQLGAGDDTVVGAPPATGGAPGSSGPGGGNGALLEDAYIGYNFGNGWGMKVGQFKLPFLREELVGDTEQLAVDRSVTNATFTQGRSQGIQVSFAQDSFRFMGALSDGFRTANTDYVSPAEADLGVTARGEFMWSGAWSQADGFTSWQNQSFFGMVGAAAHYQTGGSSFNTAAGTVPTGTAPADPADVQLFGLTADVTVKGNGWNAYGALVWTSTDGGDTPAGTVVPYPGTGTAGGPGSNSMDDLGLVLQGGIFVAPQWELFGRFDSLIPDDSRTGNDDTFSTLTLGANYYITPESHALKFTAQLGYFLDKQDQGIAPANTLTGLLGSSQDSQYAVSAQLQLVF